MPAGSPAIATAASRAGRPGTGSSRDEVPPSWSQRTGGSRIISRLRPHCFDASMIARRNRSSFGLPGSTTDRSVTIGINRSTPSSVAFSTSQSNRSPLGTAEASVSENGAGRSGRGGPTAVSSTPSVLDFDHLVRWSRGPCRRRLRRCRRRPAGRRGSGAWPRRLPVAACHSAQDRGNRTERTRVFSRTGQRLGLMVSDPLRGMKDEG